MLIPLWQGWRAVKWWGSNGMETKIIEHDFSVGGKWKYIMEMPNGSGFSSEGIYSLIETFQKIYTSVDFKPMTESVEMQYFFEEIGDQTNFTLKCIFPTEAYCTQQKEIGFYNGWGSVCDRLEEYISIKV